MVLVAGGCWPCARTGVLGVREVLPVVVHEIDNRVWKLVQKVVMPRRCLTQCGKAVEHCGQSESLYTDVGERRQEGLGDCCTPSAKSWLKCLRQWELVRSWRW